MKLGKLKKAFWEAFHQKGDLWFPYAIPELGKPGDPSDGEEETGEHFRDLLAALTGDESWTKWGWDETKGRHACLHPLDDDMELEE